MSCELLGYYNSSVDVDLQVLIGDGKYYFPIFPQCHVNQGTTTMAAYVWSVVMGNIKTRQDRLSARPVKMVLNLPLNPGFLQTSVLVSVSLRTREWVEL